MEKEIKVTVLSGLSKTDFEDIKNFGYEVDIPDNEEPRIMAYSLKPEDYIIIFAIHFSLKVADELTNRLAKKLASNFYKVIKKLWTKFKDTKPYFLESGKKTSLQTSESCHLIQNIRDRRFKTWDNERAKWKRTWTGDQSIFKVGQDAI